MSIFDIFKKNKNIINDNGLNEIYRDDGKGDLMFRYYKKNGKIHGKREMFTGNILVVTYYNDGKETGKFEVYDSKTGSLKEKDFRSTWNTIRIKSDKEK